MDIYDVTQITLIVGAGLVLARIGLALARRIERHPEIESRLHPTAEERLRTLEEDSSIMRQELLELHERQDFTERLLQSRSDPPRPASAARPEGQPVTPH